MPVKTEIADILTGADLLSVITDKLEESSTAEVMKLGAQAAAEAYQLAGDKLEADGRTDNARDAFRKAALAYGRAELWSKRKDCERRVVANRPPFGNFYDDY